MIVQDRNAAMIARIEAAPVQYPFRFVILGDTAATPRPEADAVFSGMLGQIQRLDPAPLFLANLGDFSGPGSRDRHEDYLRLVEPVAIPNICLMGNHDRDDPAGWEIFPDVHGNMDYQFAYGHTRFICINSHSCNGGRPGDRVDGPRAEDLAYLEKCLREDDHRRRIVLMHQPPDLDNHFAPPVDPGFRHLQREFLALMNEYHVDLVCAAHILIYDCHERDGTGYVTSGGGGWGLYGDFDPPIHVPDDPPHRGSFFHFVEITVAESGTISGRVIKAGHAAADPRFSFTRPHGPDRSTP